MSCYYGPTRRVLVLARSEIFPVVRRCLREIRSLSYSKWFRGLMCRRARVLGVCKLCQERCPNEVLRVFLSRSVYRRFACVLGSAVPARLPLNNQGEFCSCDWSYQTFECITTYKMQCINYIIICYVNQEISLY